jgi:hypothetical protein
VLVRWEEDEISNAKIISASLLLTIMSLSGCYQAAPTGRWYDYGSGLINLENITYIASNARLTIFAEPLMEPPTDRTSEKMAIYTARSRFCAARIETTIVKKSIGEIMQDTNFLASAKSNIDPSVLRACQITVVGDAQIEFDSFIVQLEKVSVDLNKTVKSKTEDESVSKFRSLTLEPFAGAWVQEYKKVQQLLGLLEENS